jgi:uncharacterized protein YdhG (YjbR/CyaY superfamily)
MAKKSVKSVDDYLASQPKTVRAALDRVRSAIRRAVPRAEETISYQIPTYKLNGRAILYFAGWTRHYSLYPAGANVLDDFKDDLAPFEISRGTIKFPLTQRVPVKLIAGIAKLRAKQVTEREKAASTSRKPRPTR